MRVTPPKSAQLKAEFSREQQHDAWGWKGQEAKHMSEKDEYYLSSQLWRVLGVLHCHK